MNIELKAAIIRKHGAQLHFAVAMGIQESAASGIVHAKPILDPDTRRNWAEALEAPARCLFPEGNGDV